VHLAAAVGGAYGLGIRVLGGDARDGSRGHMGFWNVFGCWSWGRGSATALLGSHVGRNLSWGWRRERHDIAADSHGRKAHVKLVYC